jgi:ssDNA-specific exonuclease RecJ
MRVLHLKNKMVYSFINNYFISNYETIYRNKLKINLINLKKINNKNNKIINNLLSNKVKIIFFKFKNLKYNFFKGIKNHTKYNLYNKTILNSLDTNIKKYSLS